MKWVLVVETEENEYRYLERIISRLGYRPYRAVTARQGHHFIAESIPDALVCGEHLPDSDPNSFCGRIKKDPQTAGIPALLTTSNKDFIFRNQARRSGFADVVHRPLSIRNFYQKLELCLSNSRRTHIRAPMCFPVDIFNKNERCTLETYNFGEGGMYLQTEDPISRKTSIDLQFKLPGFDTLLYLKGKVVHTSHNDTDEVPAGIGIQFTNLAGSLEAMLCIYMENFLAMTTPLVTTQGRLWCAENGDVRPGYSIG
jgi:DNA-binding response OmpR family regulator